MLGSQSLHTSLHLHLILVTACTPSSRLTDPPALPWPPCPQAFAKALADANAAGQPLSPDALEAVLVSQ
jgi:hypothetical protein